MSTLSDFYEGRQVVCISEKFPHVITTEKDKKSLGKYNPPHPMKGELLIIKEVLGEYLMFDKYNTRESNNWWHYTKFGLPPEEVTIQIKHAERFTF
jgi:hypothetical protein